MQTIPKFGKEDLVFLVKLSESSERFDDMFSYVSQYIEQGNEVTERERNLFSWALRKAIGKRRDIWRKLSEALETPIRETDPRVLGFVRDQLTAQIISRTSIALELITKYILPVSSSPDQRVYFTMLKADMERYNAEVSTGKDRERWVSISHSSYKDAGDIAVSRLKPTNPIRLSLMLNLSVFYYEIYNSAERACIVAKASCDDAVETGLFSKRRKNEDEDSQREAIEVYENIRSNLKRWTAHLVPHVSIP